MNLSLNRFTFFLFIGLLFFSCTKITTTDIGSGLIPPVDGVITKDTILDVITKNSSLDTAAVGISDNHVLGYVDDPVFGKTTASVNFQVGAPSYPFSWGLDKSNIVLDSVVLCLSYQSTWGDTLFPVRVHVYTMDPENLFLNDSLYPTTKVFEKGTELTESNTAAFIYPYLLNDPDTTKNYGELATAQIRIRLNKSFGQQLINYDSASVYQSDSTFYNSLRGLIVEPEQTAGNRSLLSISLTDTATHLSVYYHSSIASDTSFYNRRFSPNTLTSASSNTVLRNYQGTQIPSYINSSTPNQDLIFMQTSPGIYATISIPGLTANLGNKIIHRSELLMYQVPDATSSSDQWLTPPNLFVAALNPDSTPARRMAIPNDLIFTGTGYSNLSQFGVSPISGTNGVRYSFDLTRYTQSIVTNNQRTYNLILYAPYNDYIYPADTLYKVAYPISSPSLNSVGIGRVRLGGGSNPDPQYKMRLHIVYSDTN